MSVCLSDHDLEAFVGGTASHGRVSGWKTHLASCDSCALRLGRLQAGSSGQSEPVQAQEEVGHGSRDSDATITVKPVGKPNLDAGAASAPGDAIPGYKILKELHRGGQGVVYQAI